MKNLIIIVLLTTVSLAVQSQIYDGITQPTKYRIFIPVTAMADGSGKVTAAPFVGYKWDATCWLSLTPIVQYNINTENLSPQLWLNINACRKYYLLSRTIYDSRTGRFRETLSATVKLPQGFMVDATWEDMYNGERFAESDRLQVVGGYAWKLFVVNAGYSFRNTPGFIANIRFKVTKYNWLQLKYDSGVRSVGIGVALQFDKL